MGFVFFAGALAASAQSVYVVDDDGGPGVDFTALQPAVDIATSLDRIEIRSGQYPSAVVIDHAVTIMGEPDVRELDLLVAGLQGVNPVVLVDLPGSLVATDCTAPVLVDNSRLGLSSYFGASVIRCTDMRIAGGTFYANVGSSLSVRDSQVQIDRLRIEPDPGFLVESDGSPGLEVVGASSVTISNSVIRGDSGRDEIGDCFSGTERRNGGFGIRVFDTASVRLLRSTVFGGPRGSTIGGCGLTRPGNPVSIEGPGTIVSDGTFIDSAVQVISPLPALSLSGPFLPGSITDIGFDAVAGSSARIFLGRRPRLLPIAGSAIPLGHTAERGVSLGASPGSYTLPFRVPNIPRGTVIHLQASRTLLGGATELTNPTMLVVR